jgi:hypothetical protein
MNDDDILSVTSESNLIMTCWINHLKYSNDHVEHSGSFGPGGSSRYFGTIQERALKCKVGAQYS